MKGKKKGAHIVQGLRECLAKRDLHIVGAYGVISEAMYVRLNYEIGRLAAGCVCSKNRSIGRTTAGRSDGSVSSKMTKMADGPMFPRRPANLFFLTSAGWPAGYRPADGTVSSWLNAGVIILFRVSDKNKVMV